MKDFKKHIKPVNIAPSPVPDFVRVVRTVHFSIPPEHDLFLLEPDSWFLSADVGTTEKWFFLVGWKERRSILIDGEDIYSVIHIEGTGASDECDGRCIPKIDGDFYLIDRGIYGYLTEEDVRMARLAIEKFSGSFT